MHRGYIKLWRKTLDSGLIQLPNALALFVYMLMEAAYKPMRFGTVDLERGQLVTGRHKMAEKLAMSEQSIRTALEHLIKLDFVTSKSTNRYTVYTIVNYNKYQDTETQSTNETPTSNQQATNKQPTSNQQATTNKEVNKEKKEKNVKKNTAAIAVDIFPDVFNRQLVDDWLVIRKAKKLPVTETALDGITREFLKAGYSNEDGLRKCCEKGWAGFEAKWVFADAKGLEQQGDQAREEARARLFGGN